MKIQDISIPSLWKLNSEVETGTSQKVPIADQEIAFSLVIKKSFIYVTSDNHVVWNGE